MSYLPQTIQSASPTTGQTVSITESQADVVLDLTPVGALLSLTVNLPATGRAGQRIFILSSQAVTTLTLGNLTFGTLTALVAGASHGFIRNSAGTLHRMF